MGNIEDNKIVDNGKSDTLEIFFKKTEFLQNDDIEGEVQVSTKEPLFIKSIKISLGSYAETTAYVKKGIEYVKCTDKQRTIFEDIPLDLSVFEGYKEKGHLFKKVKHLYCVPVGQHRVSFKLPQKQLNHHSVYFNEPQKETGIPTASAKVTNYIVASLEVSKEEKTQGNCAVKQEFYVKSIPPKENTAWNRTASLINDQTGKIDLTVGGKNNYIAQGVPMNLEVTVDNTKSKKKVSGVKVEEFLLVLLTTKEGKKKRTDKFEYKIGEIIDKDFKVSAGKSKSTNIKIELNEQEIQKYTTTDGLALKLPSIINDLIEVKYCFKITVGVDEGGELHHSNLSFNVYNASDVEDLSYSRVISNAMSSREEPKEPEPKEDPKHQPQVMNQPMYPQQFVQPMVQPIIAQPVAPMFYPQPVVPMYAPMNMNPAPDKKKKKKNDQDNCKVPYGNMVPAFQPAYIPAPQQYPGYTNPGATYQY